MSGEAHTRAVDLDEIAAETRATRDRAARSRVGDPGRAPRARGRPRLLSDPDLYLNRELSWLEFNRRVLALATDPEVPLLERLRFVAIFADNLDEFFMVRVAGLKRQDEAGVRRPTAEGLSPAQQLEAVSERLHPMVVTAGELLDDLLVPLLARQGLELESIDTVTDDELAWLDGYFDAEVFPVLTPLAFDPGRPFPYISNLSLSLAVEVRDATTHQRRFARVKVPGVLPRFVALPHRQAWVPLEELIRRHLDRLFAGMDVLAASLFRVTRNADLDLEEDEADDLLLAIQEELRKRRFGQVVRLEVAEGMPDQLRGLLQNELRVSDADTYPVAGLLGLDDLDELVALDRPELRFEPAEPVPHPDFAGAEVSTDALFATLRRRDVLVHHPYDSFSHTVERFVAAAAEDPQVLAIKQTLYRTSGDSPIVRSLIRAAEQGKQVVALIELKARFDEEANIAWARALEKVGAHVVYGLVGLKTHAKTTLVVRRELTTEGNADPNAAPRWGLRRYVHIGTGNYNPTTARLYTDLGLLSSAPDLGADLTDLFNFLTGYARQDAYRQLLVAPLSLRERITELIQREITLHSCERPGFIRLKLNNLIDSALIAELYRASQAGVQVHLVVRGICGLRPGLPGVSDRIQVVSIVGRLLEHARVMQFGPDDFWIGSADWMPRNLDRRVEVMTPVHDPRLRDELRHVLDLQTADNTGAWQLYSDGSWSRRVPEDGEAVVNSQALLRARVHQR